MSLIKCLECGKEISDKAPACIHCGCPIHNDKNNNTTKIFVYSCKVCVFNNNNPFKEFNEYKGSTLLCPDCGGQLNYCNTCIIDNNTGLVVEKYEEESYKNEQNAKNQNTPHCPICNSPNLSKISSVKKAAKVGLFGIFGAGDVGKTWKCNSCGSKF